MKIVCKEIRNIAIAIRAYNHVMRQNIIYLLRKNPGVIVGKLVEELDENQSVVSQHLSILREADLVRTETNGKNIKYYVKEESLRQLEHLAEHWANNTTPQPPRSDLAVV